jgi:hypothetical protein
MGGRTGGDQHDDSKCDGKGYSMTHGSAPS